MATDRSQVALLESAASTAEVLVGHFRAVEKMSRIDGAEDIRKCVDFLEPYFTRLATLFAEGFGCLEECRVSVEIGDGRAQQSIASAETPASAKEGPKKFWTKLLNVGRGKKDRSAPTSITREGNVLRYNSGSHQWVKARLHLHDSEQGLVLDVFPVQKSTATGAVTMPCRTIEATSLGEVFEQGPTFHIQAPIVGEIMLASSDAKDWVADIQAAMRAESTGEPADFVVVSTPASGRGSPGASLSPPSRADRRPVASTTYEQLDDVRPAAVLRAASHPSVPAGGASRAAAPSQYNDVDDVRPSQDGHVQYADLDLDAVARSRPAPRPTDSDVTYSSIMPRPSDVPAEDPASGPTYSVVNRSRSQEPPSRPLSVVGPRSHEYSNVDAEVERPRDTYSVPVKRVSAPSSQAPSGPTSPVGAGPGQAGTLRAPARVSSSTALPPSAGPSPRGSGATAGRPLVVAVDPASNPFYVGGDPSPAPAPASASAGSFDAVEAQLQSYTWYHGGLPTADAVFRVESAGSGSFLVRKSESQRGQFVLCVNWLGNASLFRVPVNADGSCKMCGLVFPSMVSLIMHFSRTPFPTTPQQVGQVVKLTQPVAVGRAQNARPARRDEDDSNV